MANETRQRSIATGAANTLLQRYQAVRDQTMQLVAPLSEEDACVQSMPAASPAKWHLAHTTWFFEQFLLGRDGEYAPYAAGWDYLFNSYYQSVGPMHARPQRGMLTRPSLDAVRAYRAEIDARMMALIARDDDADTVARITLGLHHEQQHQELILTDIKHLLSLNPLEPSYRELGLNAVGSAPALHFVEGDNGVTAIGHEGEGFAFDCETPRHQTMLHPHALANRLVTNAEFRAFIEDGGYREPTLWLSDGWDTVSSQGWQHPLYWSDDLESEFTLAGRRTIDPHAPVVHVSYFEADAFARWAGARLPSEAEWEHAASGQPVSGNLLDSGRLHPRAASDGEGLLQLWGDVWEWTASPYVSYPGYQPLPGALGEYNGKFMCGQFVLRGGSVATPADHIRASYRNFFGPADRWQFTGIRLARDL
ncbi:ergothioneine biosynthesis protein EgtB [Algiphilus sp.]|uniref:ergothioneine biosynthesis protein EgtB n=1 Tax=Algiphilus sp. TaxID=1872431 RepID=UPI003B51CC6B